MLAIRLPDKIEKRLDRLAKRTGRTKTYYAREAILQHLEELEDIYLAEKRLAEIRAGRVRTIPLEKVMRRYGLNPKSATAEKSIRAGFRSG
jgi:RHH-type transcriptional regulator, rel operon repressor / antitoxin RelB